MIYCPALNPRGVWQSSGDPAPHWFVARRRSKRPAKLREDHEKIMAESILGKKRKTYIYIALFFFERQKWVSSNPHDCSLLVWPFFRTVGHFQVTEMHANRNNEPERRPSKNCGKRVRSIQIPRMTLEEQPGSSIGRWPTWPDRWIQMFNAPNYFCQISRISYD